MLFFLSLQEHFFFTLCVFLYIITNSLNVVTTIKSMPFSEIADFLVENYYKRIRFSIKSSYYSMKRLKRKDLLLLANKLIVKVTDPRNGKEHYESCLIKKNIKSVKHSQIITCQPKTFDTVDKKSVITEHPKTSPKLSRTIRQSLIRRKRKF